MVLALLLDENVLIRKRQYAVLKNVIGELNTKNVVKVQQLVSEWVRTQTLSLIDLTLPTLREMTVEQYQRFKLCIHQLIKADKKIEPTRMDFTTCNITAPGRALRPSYKTSGKVFCMGFSKICQ